MGDINDIETFVGLLRDKVLNNKEIIEEMHQSISTEMGETINEEINKAVEQWKEYIKNKKESGA